MEHLKDTKMLKYDVELAAVSLALAYVTQHRFDDPKEAAPDLLR